MCWASYHGEKLLVVDEIIDCDRVFIEALFAPPVSSRSAQQVRCVLVDLADPS